MQKNDIICFFYIDNIVFIFKKNKYKNVKKIVTFLSKPSTIERKRELNFFLHIYIIRNRLKKPYGYCKKHIS